MVNISISHWVNPKFCVNCKTWCKKSKIILGGSGANCFRLVYKITALRGEVKGGGVSLRSSERCCRTAQTIDIPACSRSIRHTSCEEYRQLCVYHAPVLPPAGPFLRNIHHRRIEHLEQTVIRREDRFCLGHFPELPVKALDRIGRIDQAAHLLRYLK